MERSEVTKLLLRISAAYGRRKPDSDIIDEWHRHLEDADPQAIHRALDRRIEDGEPGPTIADLLSATGASRRNYDYTPPVCERCDSTGQMLVEQTIIECPRNVRPNPEHRDAWYTTNVGWETITVPAGHTIDRRYAPCTACR